MPHGNLELLAEKSKRTYNPQAKKEIDDENDEKYKLSYAFQNLTNLPESSLPDTKSNILVLDLTENNFTGSNDLRFLIEFPKLKTLILDKNQIQSNIRLPLMENLTTLWVNHNKIENLAIFIQNLQESCINLKYLSMINNKAAPSYFNGGSLNEYNDYRLFVISKLKNLNLLDDKIVTAEERSQSLTFYGKTRSNTQRKNSIQDRKIKSSSKKSNRKEHDLLLNDDKKDKNFEINDKSFLEEQQELEMVLPNLNDDYKLTNENYLLEIKNILPELDQSNDSINEYMPDLPNLTSKSQIFTESAPLPPPPPPNLI
ncbi:unnamed protein product [Brachionus calyciflorus]|uniref:Uncharacterized protein n=1 Tax=Brachionus calyciflorus TaxID=104777 RepID=A0A814D8I2_9BILA|nr:unnamed protein product [Brachionus calyciflorus]